jgi:gluconokinase
MGRVMQPKFFLLMGVSGCGKTTIGKALAHRLGWDFYDADDFHPPANVAKMAGGIPLSDKDRAPWLAALHELISSCLKADRSAVLACSALRERYRQQLLGDNIGVQIVYLKGSFNLIRARMTSRSRHYMQSTMLQSQFDALEEPCDALVIDASLSVDEIVAHILEKTIEKK